MPFRLFVSEHEFPGFGCFVKNRLWSGWLGVSDTVLGASVRVTGAAALILESVLCLHMNVLGVRFQTSP